MTAHSEHGGGQDALDRELASCEEDEPPWPNIGDQGPLTEATLRAMETSPEYLS